jgi:hypothetical protein
MLGEVHFGSWQCDGAAFFDRMRLSRTMSAERERDDRGHAGSPNTLHTTIRFS